jgi:integrase
MSGRGAPSFLIQNRLGVYYFQRRVPRLRSAGDFCLPPFIRLSLRTKRWSEATRLARQLAAMMDKRAKKFFSSEDAFHEAMVLFERFVTAQRSCSSFDELQAIFLDSLDDTTANESELLEQAARYHRSKQLDQGMPYEGQITDLLSLLRSALPAHQQSANSSSSPTTPIDKGVMLSDAFESFIEHKRMGWKAAGGMETGFRQSIFPVFIGVTGDIPTRELTKAHVNDYIRLVQRMPANKTKFAAYKDIPIREFMAMDVPSEDRLSAKSVDKYLSQIGTFLRWLRVNDHTEIELDLPLASVSIKKTRAVDQKQQFSCKDLERIFNSDRYTKGRHRTASQFWVPLLGIYTGARLNEICQLAVADVYKDPKTGRLVIDFNENTTDVEHKTLKRDFHARKVPIHKRLLDLGFEHFVNLQKRHKQKRLFPELPYNNNANKYGDKLQRWFNRTYLKNCSVTTPKTSFHSLRHTVTSHLTNDHQIDANKIAVALGQSPVGGVTQTTYSKRASLEHYLGYFDLINFDKCFSIKKIVPWNRQAFSKP